MTALFLKGFLFLAKNSGGSVLHAKKGKPVFFREAKLFFLN